MTSHVDLVQTLDSPETAAVSVCFPKSDGNDYVCWYKLIPKEFKVTTEEALKEDLKPN